MPANGLGYWNELTKGMLEVKICVIHWGSDQRGKRDESRFSVTEPGMRLAGLGMEEHKDRRSAVSLYQKIPFQ